jgi:hypothetical protein
MPLRAQVHRLDVDRDAVRLHQLGECIGDLLAQTLLHREAAREQAHQAGQLRDANDLLVRHVADVGEAVERQRVVLAERIEGDRALDDLADEAVAIAATLSRKSGQQLVVALVAGSRLVERLQEACWRPFRAGGVEVHPEGREDLRNRVLKPQPVRRLHVPRRDLLPRHRLLRVA